MIEVNGMGNSGPKEMSASTATCPVAHDRDDRKSARIAESRFRLVPGSRNVGDVEAGRELYRSLQVRQWGAHATEVDIENPRDVSFFFLDGPEHRKRRGAVAGIFTPRAIATKHRAVMESRMDSIVAELTQKGRGVLDEMSWSLAVDVAATIIGLTESKNNDALARRVKDVLDIGMDRRPGFLGKLGFAMKTLMRVNRFWKKDMVPAIRSRKREPREDVISFMVEQNYSKKGMIMEALSYAGAGMVTTREFIVMAAWHMFDNDALRERFLVSDEADQIGILEEILRLEPVLSLNLRRAVAPIPDAKAGAIAEGELLSLNIREMNTDEAMTGPCPYALDPDRAKRMKVVGAYMSFGDGPHRCPGAQVALHETRVFVDRLFRLPGVRLENPPEIQWNPHAQGYKLRGAVVSVDTV